LFARHIDRATWLGYVAVHRLGQEDLP